MREINLDRVFALSRITSSINRLTNLLITKQVSLGAVERNERNGCAISKAQIPSIKRDIEKLITEIEAQELLKEML